MSWSRSPTAAPKGSFGSWITAHPIAEPLRSNDSKVPTPMSSWCIYRFTPVGSTKWKFTSQLSRGRCLLPMILLPSKKSASASWLSKGSMSRPPNHLSGSLPGRTCRTSWKSSIRSRQWLWPLKREYVTEITPQSTKPGRPVRKAAQHLRKAGFVLGEKIENIRVKPQRAALIFFDFDEADFDAYLRCCRCCPASCIQGLDGLDVLHVQLFCRVVGGGPGR